MKKRYKVTDIEWCMDEDDDRTLPTECVVEIDLDDYGYTTESDMIEYREDEADIIVNEVTERYFSLIYGLNYEEI